MLNKLYLHIMFKMQMIEAYLAYHRGEMLLCAEYENDALRYESELQRLEILK